jgi:hypothetical protein
MQSSEGPDSGTNSERTRDRKYWIALALFGILAVGIWFTFGEATVFVFGRQVQLRLIPLFVVATFIFRTYMAREADKIRRRSAGEWQGKS